MVDLVGQDDSSPANPGDVGFTKRKDGARGKKVHRVKDEKPSQSTEAAVDIETIIKIILILILLLLLILILIIVS